MHFKNDILVYETLNFGYLYAFVCIKYVFTGKKKYFFKEKVRKYKYYAFFSLSLKYQNCV